MAFTENDRRDLETARRVVKALETKETEALSEVERVLSCAGLRVAHDSFTWRDIVCHADTIRDVLAPFDSGVRVAPDGL